MLRCQRALARFVYQPMNSFIGESGKLRIAIPLTTYLTDVLDTHKVPYTFTTAPGGHEGAYWAEHMEEYIQFLISN